jgi:hypothetical protein
MNDFPSRLPKERRKVEQFNATSTLHPNAVINFLTRRNWSTQLSPLLWAKFFLVFSSYIVVASDALWDGDASAHVALVSRNHVPMNSFIAN